MTKGRESLLAGTCSKSVCALAIAIGLGFNADDAMAAPLTGEMCVFNAGGEPLADASWSDVCDTDISGNIGTTSWSVSSPNSYFSFPWTAHSGTLFGEGTHVVDTIGGGSYTFDVGVGQVGGHILIDWNSATDIDVVNVWDVACVGLTCTYVSTDIDGDGTPGIGLIDGPFPGFSLNWNFTAVPVPAAVWLFGSGLLGLIGVARRKQRI